MRARRMVPVVVIGLLLLEFSMGHGRAMADEPIRPQQSQPPSSLNRFPRSRSPRLSNRAQQGETQSRRRRRDLRQTGARPRRPAALPHPPATLTGKDGAPMVLVPAGEFTMGSEQGDDDEQPVHRVFLDSFYLDTFEVTNGRFAKFVAAIQSEPPWGFADQETPVIHAEQPVRWVNWLEATGYCLWAGKRLPTEAEWEKAARGTDGRVYPWGNEPPTPAHAVFGLKEGAETVSPIGNRDLGRSPYGVHDLAGNLYEWVADWYDEAFYTPQPADQSPRPGGGHREGATGRVLSSIVPIGSGPPFGRKAIPPSMTPTSAFAVPKMRRPCP